ncbi:hypothetical protein M8818_003646 [Zalaria obscura]|uniref:Uncharacterized protein n=1 Tax=Zalaria obscura TaxID=2024903 RepID=A0ACC3SEE5_9PEZI
MQRLNISFHCSLFSSNPVDAPPFGDICDFGKHRTSYPTKHGAITIHESYGILPPVSPTRLMATARYWALLAGSVCILEEAARMGPSLAAAYGDDLLVVAGLSEGCAK